jgi:hypothetical protein
MEIASYQGKTTAPFAIGSSARTVALLDAGNGPIGPKIGQRWIILASRSARSRPHVEIAGFSVAAHR